VAQRFRHDAQKLEALEHDNCRLSILVNSHAASIARLEELLASSRARVEQLLKERGDYGTQFTGF
jgi:hypothetical protein